MSFMKVERSFKTPRGWRLATVQEVNNNIESVKKVLKGTDRARLLDGWIGGPYYHHKIENTFNAFLDSMLVTKAHTQQINSSNSGEKELYDGIDLCDEGKHVALFLCACDWNYEVLYWLLNSWDKNQTADSSDVSDGKIPFNNESLVQEMLRLNKLTSNIARMFGDAFVGQKTRYKKFTKSSVTFILGEAETSIMAKFTDAECILGEAETSIVAKFTDADKKFLKDAFRTCKEFYEKNYSLLEDEYSNWELVWNHFCAFHVLFCSQTTLSFVIKKLLQNISPEVSERQRNFILSTYILYYISQVCLNFHEKFIPITRDAGLNVFNEILHLAVREGNIVIMKKMLDCGVDLLRKGLEERQSALHVAFKHIKDKDTLEKAVKILVDGCDSKEQLVNIADEKGESVLHMASCKRSVEICRCLLDHGANPNVKNELGLPPLHYAVMAGINPPLSGDRGIYIKEALDVVQVLLQRGNRDHLLNYSCESGKTFLHLASKVRWAEMCKLLLDIGANPNAKDKDGLLPLHHAVKHGLASFVPRSIVSETIKVVQNLLERSDDKEQSVNSPYPDGKTVLHLASLEGNAEMCELLLDNGAKPDSKDNSGESPMHSAVKSIGHGDINEVIKLVLIYLDRSDENTQLVNLPDNKGKTVLHLVSSKGKAFFCRLLLDYGAQPDAKDNEGKLPLHYANNDETIGVLFKASSQESTNSYLSEVDGSELLRKFASEGNVEMVERLLESTASPEDVDRKGKTALHHAAMCQNYGQASRTIKIILSKCQDQKKLISSWDENGKTAVHVAALNGKMFFSSINSIDINDRDGRSPLHEATQGKEDDAQIIRVIIRNRKPPYGNKSLIRFDSLTDNRGLTPLHLAASKGKVYQVDALLEESEDPKKYVKRGDCQGQTALHKAAKGGYRDTVTVLLHWGAQPLLERDCDGRTALHYAVEAGTDDAGIGLVELLLKTCGSKEKKLLFLCTSAAGLGIADQNLTDCPLKRFLGEEMSKLGKEKGMNLLRAAARVGSTGMAKEMLTKGYQITDIQQNEWLATLKGKEKDRVNRVLEEIKTTAEQGNDRPSLSDNLGRADFARGLAALLLNPYLKPPIAIGISGNWGMGKSSLMFQTEITLLKTAAQAALLPDSQSPRSDLPGLKKWRLSEVGKKRYLKIQRWLRALKSKESQAQQPEVVSVENFLKSYEPRYHKIFKSLAAIDSSDMLIREAPQPFLRGDSPSEGSVPAIITVQYNAWKYMNESEAMAGMAVEITKEMEEIMTEPQWLSTCWRNTWRTRKHTIWIEVISPFLLATFLAGMVTWIVWLLIDRYNVKEGVKLKYAFLPSTIVIMVWTLVKSAMSVVKPVSTQLMNYVKFPDHTDNLGYQDRVISDIKFLKVEIRRKPYLVFTAASFICHLVTECCIVSFFCRRNSFRDTLPSKILASTAASNSIDNLRIIVFVDDLDRCQESVILKVLSAFNLVLAVCEINAIVGMDKALIQKAIMKKHGDSSLKNNEKLADRYLQKIIQLPIDLPDPSKDEFEGFLKTQLGVFSIGSKGEDVEVETDADDDSESGIDSEYNALISRDELDNSTSVDSLMKMFSTDTLMQARVSGDINPVTEMEENSHPQSDDIVDIVVNNGHGANTEGSGRPNLFITKLKEIWPKLSKCPIRVQNCPVWTVWNAVKAPFTHKPIASLDENTGDQHFIESIPIREMLFVRYSEGEQEAFFYFQKMATDWRRMPRQWKCLLYYHRLIWYIFSMSKDARTLNGWQLQLISWIFLCWECEENMNVLIQKWKKIDILKTYESKSGSGSGGPSLGAIVEHYIKNMSDSGNEKQICRVSEKPENEKINSGKPRGEVNEKGVSKNNREEVKADKVEEDVKRKGISKDTEDPESGSRKREAMETEDHMVAMPEGMKENNPYNSVADEDGVSNKVVEKLELLVKDQMTAAETSNRAISEKLERALMELDEMKKEIRDLKEAKQQARKDEKYDEEDQTRQNNWDKMKEALEKYDVSMQGIQAFQRFRFFCVAGHLPWPLPKQPRDVMR